MKIRFILDMFEKIPEGFASMIKHLTAIEDISLFPGY